MGDIGSCIQVASFVLVLNLLLSRVSSLVVWCLGVSSPTPKAEDLSDCVRAAFTGHVQGELVLQHDERWQLQQ